MSPIIIIPSRMASKRLPGKPLADILGKPMIARVVANALAANIGPVIVACDSQKIARAVQDQNGTAILTDPDLASGSDRVQAALTRYDPQGQYDIIINLQGDIPLLPPSYLRDLLIPLRESSVDIASLVCPLAPHEEAGDPNLVKVAVSFRPKTTHNQPRTGRALYFSRKGIPGGKGPIYTHIGIYAYRRSALEQFARLPKSPLEERENLEQLRALENGLRIDVTCVDTPCPGVDTQQDLEIVRDMFAGSHSAHCLV